MTLDLAADLELAVAAAIRAGKHLTAAFGGAGRVWYKSAQQPVTDADLEADRIVREMFRGARPEYRWISEEMEDGVDGSVPIDDTPTWVVDPLDGTANFVEGVPEFAICIGLIDAGLPVLGVVYDPIHDTLYTATADAPALRDGTPISARRDPAPRRLLVAAAGELRSGKLDPFLRDWETTLLGSTALKMMRVAEGGADAYVSGTLKGVWDFCAGSVIARSAGAVVRDLQGEALDFSAPSRRARGLIVAGPEAEDEIPSIVNLARRGGLPPRTEEQT